MPPTSSPVPATKDGGPLLNTEVFHEELNDGLLPHSEDTELDNNIYTCDDLDHDLDMMAMLQFCAKIKSSTNNWAQLQIDNDIQALVNGFVQDFSSSVSTDITGNALISKSLKDTIVEISKWLGAKIQMERDGWTLKLKMALHEAEGHRKAALKGDAVIQECCDQLKILLECLNVSENILAEIPPDDNRAALYKAIEILAEICNAVMEDRFECMTFLGIDEENGFSLSEILKERFQELETNYIKQKEDALNRQTSAELETSHLLKEINKMKKLMTQKQEDVEWLQQQLEEINDIIHSQNVDKTDKATGTETPRKGQSVMTSHSQQTQSIINITAFTQTAKEASMIQISEDKLRALKQRAQKLEDSLNVAITSMEKLQPSTNAVSENTVTKRQQDLSQLVIANRGEGFKLKQENKRKLKPPYKDRKRTTFEIKGPNMNSVFSMPTLALRPLEPPQRRCLSERAPLKETKINRPEKVAAHMTQLRSKKPRVGRVSKCLRCQKLFRSIDNHKLACCYHPKGKERVEKYNDGGQLLKVIYTWQCCNQEINSEGCCTGQHV